MKATTARERTKAIATALDSTVSALHEMQRIDLRHCPHDLRDRVVPALEHLETVSKDLREALQVNLVTSKP